MAELKTRVTNKSVAAFIKTVEDKVKRSDSEVLVKLFEKVTKEKAKLWGTSMIGFGMYHYESTKSAQKGDWPLTAFSPRKQNLTIYLMCGCKEYTDLLAKLGKHKTSGSCVYIKKLADVDIGVLEQIIKRSFADMKRKYLKK